MANTTDDLRLISRFLDRDLTPEEVSLLDKRVTEDPEFSELLARCSLTHRQVLELFHEDKLHELLDQAVLGAPSLPKGLRTPPLPAAGTWHRPFQFRAAWVGLAAALCIVAAGLYFWQNPLTPREDQVAQPAPSQTDAEQEWSVVATVTRAADCMWPDGAQPMNVGDQLEEGAHVVLESGLVKLTFECGAEVVLKGPCDFLVENSMLGYLKSGCVTASVPRRAFTFAIRAPGIDFVDLGTDFGISVDEGGQSELHVFEGEVVYRQDIEKRKSSDVVHVLEDEAVQFKTPLDNPSDIEVNRDLFSSHFKLRNGEFSGPVLPVGRDLTLWLSADEGVSTDDDGHVISWHDRLLGDNKVAEDAFQMNQPERPLLQPGAVNGLPAVRFDGQDDFMLTTPIETTDNQTVFLVCRFTPAAFSEDRIYGGQILNYDGPPTRELTSTLAPGVLQIGEPLLQEEFQPSLLTAQVFAGFVGKTTVEAGRVDSYSVGVDTPVIVCYRYDYNNRKAELMLNGQTCSEAKAFAPAGLTSRKVIGRHAWMELFFHGDLAELLIFNRALGDQETGEVTRHLAERYAIALQHDSLAADLSTRGAGSTSSPGF